MRSPATGARTALSDCSAPLKPGQKYVAVRLLTGDMLNFVTEVKNRCKNVFEQVINYLGLSDAELFGLAIKTENEYKFIDQWTKLHKCVPKAWRSQHGSGLDDSGMPLLIFHLRVQLYVDCHLLISDKVARHHYYLQMKENVLQYFLPLSEEKAFLLAANALQADMGNFQVDKHTGNYFNPFNYFPFWVVKRYGEAYIQQHAPTMHRENQGQSRGEAQVGYIKEASEPTAPHNLHLYKMKRKKAKTQDTVWLGVSAKSLEVFEDNGNLPKTQLSRFPWADIAKLTFEKKKFEIRSLGAPDSRKFVYYSNNEDMVKGLFWLCRLTHQFNMAVQYKEQELKKLELEGQKSFRESYIYSDSSDLNWEPGRSEILSLSNGFLKKNAEGQNLDQRISVISNVSSNTTSGIVSDKVHSFCESEDELGMENKSSSTDAAENVGLDQTDHITRQTHKARSASVDFNPLIRSSGFSLLAESQTDDMERASNPRSVAHKVNSTTSDESSTSDATAWKYISLPDVPPPKIPVMGSSSTTNAQDSQSQLTHSHSCQNNCLFHNQTDISTKDHAITHKASFTSNCSEPSENLHLQTKNLNEAINVGVTLKPQYKERTRIGVSSLNRVHKLPLTLFGSGQTGSEPSLNHMPMWSQCRVSGIPSNEIPNVIAQYYYENSVKVLGGMGNLNSHRHSVATGSADYTGIPVDSMPILTSSSSRSTGSIPQDLSMSSSLTQFKCIPPPPAYRNGTTTSPQLSQCHSISLQTLQEKKPEHRRYSQAESQSVLDLHLLRQKSIDLDLPLMAALCNDRSLVMPKTVPTCSRQRHINAAKDLRRFSCSHVSSLSEDQCALHRSRDWVNVLPTDGTGPYARTYSHSCPPPPTILTSFVKTALKKDGEGPYQNGQGGSRQLLPLKLSLVHSTGFPNGCIHAT